MRVVVTGTDRAPGAFVARSLAAEHEVVAAGSGPAFGSVAACEGLLREAGALVHFDPFELEGDGRGGDGARLHGTLFGTYNLLLAAAACGVGRVVHASSLRFFRTCPDRFAIDERWRPRPSPDLAEMAPWMVETMVREFALERWVGALCLRFLPFGPDAAAETRAEWAARAVGAALRYEFTTPGYRWQAVHVAGSDRFVTRQCRLTLGFDPKVEG